jgi:hypothetical protein
MESQEVGTEANCGRNDFFNTLLAAHRLIPISGNIQFKWGLAYELRR